MSRWLNICISNMLTSAQIQQMNQITGMNKPVTPQQSQAQSRVAELTAIAQKAQARPAIADVGIGAAKTAANFVEQGDVLGTMNRLAKGDTSDLNTNKIPNMIDAANPLKTMHSLSGDTKDWTGRDTSVTPSETPDWSGTSPAQRAQMEQPSNYAQKVGQSGAIIAANTLPIVAPGLKRAAGGLKEALTPKPPTPEEVAAQQQRATEVASQERQAKIQKGGEAWEHPTKPGVATNPASFKNATSIVEKNPGVPTFLAQNKMHPNAFMENGRYDTADAAEGMREDAVKMSKEALRPALEAANPSVPVTHAPDVLTRAFQSLSQDKRLTPGDRIKVANNIMNEARALGNEHPNGMSLTDTFDKRIVYDKNSGYHAGKSLDDTNAAIANQHLGHAMRDIVNEKSAQAGLDTESFQDELSKYFRAADYLDALNTKKVPQSLVSKIANRAAAVMGAAAGHSFSGGILGGVGGYVIGGALEHMAENFVGKRGGEFLNNLEKSNPKAFEAVKEYIQKTENERAGQMKLPPGAEKGSPANPHIVPPKETSGVEMVPAGKYPTSANPKTGRFQTMYHEGQGKLEPDGFDPKASGGGPKTQEEGGVVFSSPNIREGLNFDDAQKLLTSEEHARTKSVYGDLGKGLGLDTLQHDAVGGWKDGAENTVMTEVKNAKSLADVEHLGALQGDHSYQKGVINFFHNPTGTDSLYVIDLPREDAHGILDALKNNGLEYYTKSGSKWMVFDQGSTLGENINNFAKQYGAKAQRAKGEGSFIGGNTRAEGKQAFRKVIQSHRGNERSPGMGTDNADASGPKDGGVTKPRETAGSSGHKYGLLDEGGEVKPSFKPFVDAARNAKSFAEFARGTFVVPIDALKGNTSVFLLSRGISRTPHEPVYVTPPMQGNGEYFSVQDGNHRLRDAKARGDKTIAVKFNPSSYVGRAFWATLQDFYNEAINPY